MKKAINIWSFPDQEDLRGCIDLAAKAGFEGIELAVAASGLLSPEYDAGKLRSLREYAQDKGIVIHSVAGGLGWDFPFTSDDPAVRDRALDIAVKQLGMAKELGADGVLILPGLVGSEAFGDGSVVRYDIAYDRALDAFRKLAPVAEKLDIQIGVENVWNRLLLSPMEMRDFVDKIGSSHVGVYFDVGNVLYTGYPEHWIEILGNRIKKVHFKDYRRSIGTLDGFVDLLSGDVNWPAVMEAFEKVGYSGWASAEMIPAYAHYPEQSIYNTSYAMDKILGRETTC